MGEPFIGSEALASRHLTPYALRSGFIAIHRDVYVPEGVELTAVARARAAWLWSGRKGVVAGRSAAALHGAKWVPDHAPAQILYGNRRPPKGIDTWSDRYAPDEIQSLRGIVVTTPARTALDIACRYPLGQAVAAIDALAHATKLKMADVELLVERHRGRRGIRAALEALALVDAGAESPQETRVRLVLIAAGFPRPETQIPVYDEYGQLVAVIDMGWSDIKVGVDYDGEHHRMTRRQFDRDIRRFEAVTECSWVDVRITAEDSDSSIIGRVRRAFHRRT
jgi:hypothetical protein